MLQLLTPGQPTTKSIAASTSLLPCALPHALSSSSWKACTPSETLVTPTAPTISSSLAASNVPGSISIDTSAPVAIAPNFARISLSTDSTSRGGTRDGVPPPKKTVLMGG